ncbi:MAG: hypothetical protein BZ137_07205 [Methanosphaera sp. rholeuAM130]|nr:MAG: hypothetical protein BZ137_07205 [Methanosphaera sp. rholeuAM130]
MTALVLMEVKPKHYANKYNNLTNEGVLKLLYIIHKGIIIDEEENKALENRQNKTIKNDNDKKEQIKEALKEFGNIHIKTNEKPRSIKKIEHPETAYKQVRKLEKCNEELEHGGKNTVNYTDPEARKSPNKEQVMQTGYNEQIVVDNKNGLIIAVDVTQDANDLKQLIPMIQKTQETLLK